MTKCPNVLIADDTPDVLEMLRIAAETRGWCVETVATAEEMLGRINARCDAGECFDAVISDIRFVSPQPGVPLLDGVSALREVRKKFANLPFILYSAYIEPLSRAEIVRLGGEAVSKSINLGDLLDRVEHTISLLQPVYTGPDRRRKSINRSGHYRRATDHPALQVPRAIEEVHRAVAARKAS